MEDLEEEISVGVALGVGRCTRLCVISAEKTVKFLLDQLEISQYFVVIVLKEWMVEVQRDLEDLVLEKVTIQINNYWNK